MEIIGRVQDCGCIALVPEIQEQTGLYPGATFRIELTPDIRVLLIPFEPEARRIL
jgi:hypothetical protein